MVLRKNGIKGIADHFSIKTNMYRLLGERNDIAPTTLIPVIRRVDTGSALRPEPTDELEVAELSWWLIPRWAKERGKFATFNAAAETVATKPSFRQSFIDRRCLITIDGFYEWRDRKDPDRRRRVIRFADRRAFTVAGLWDRAVMESTGEEIDSCTIITTEANALLRAVPHKRMPVILDGDARDRWLSPDTSPQDAQSLLVPRSPEGMEMLIAPGPYERDEDCIVVEIEAA